MISALDLAKYLLAKVDEQDEFLSHLKLQKLLFYTQGFHLGITGCPVFAENLLAWEHGPVVREVWDAYKSHGACGIAPPDDIPELSEETRQIVDDVWRAYGQFSAWRLREISHEAPPWAHAYPNGVISHDAMRSFFETQLTGA